MPNKMQHAFDKLLELFVSSTATSMKAARELADMCILHYAGPNKDGTGDNAGDLSFAQKFLESMPKNYIRRQAFLTWLSDFAPVTMDGSKLIKDKSEAAVKRGWRVDLAIATSFWEYSPVPALKIFGSKDVVTAVQQAVAKFSKTNAEGKDRYEATGNGSEALTLARNMVTKLVDAIGAINDNRTEQEKQEDEQIAGATEEEAPQAAVA